MSPGHTSNADQHRRMRERQAEAPPPDPEAFYAERVTASLAKAAKGFAEAGEWLIEAREELPNGSFKGWVTEHLPISPSAASRLMTIARGLIPRVSNWKLLPPAERTLYDLARLDDDEWEKVRPKLSPETTRKELRALLGDDSGHDWRNHWKGMPDYSHEDLTPHTSVKVHFSTPKDMETFSDLVGQNIYETTKSIWYPEAEIGRYADKVYVRAVQE